MAVTTGAAILGAALIGAGSAYYQGEKQEDIANEQQSRLDQERKEQEEEQRRIARDTKPEELTAEGVKLGGDTPLGDAYSEFLTAPTSKPFVGTTGTSGLGFAV